MSCSSSHFADFGDEEDCLAIAGQQARQWPDFPRANQVPKLGRRGNKPGLPTPGWNDWGWLEEIVDPPTGVFCVQQWVRPGVTAVFSSSHDLVKSVVNRTVK